MRGRAGAWAVGQLATKRLVARRRRRSTARKCLLTAVVKAGRTNGQPPVCQPDAAIEGSCHWSTLRAQIGIRVASACRDIGAIDAIDAFRFISENSHSPHTSHNSSQRCRTQNLCTTTLYSNVACNLACLAPRDGVGAADVQVSVSPQLSCSLHQLSPRRGRNTESSNYSAAI